MSEFNYTKRHRDSPQKCDEVKQECRKCLDKMLRRRSKKNINRRGSLKKKNKHKQTRSKLKKTIHNNSQAQHTFFKNGTPSFNRHYIERFGCQGRWNVMDNNSVIPTSPHEFFLLTNDSFGNSQCCLATHNNVIISDNPEDSFLLSDESFEAIHPPEYNSYEYNQPKTLLASHISNPTPPPRYDSHRFDNLDPLPRYHSNVLVPTAPPLNTMTQTSENDNSRLEKQEGIANEFTDRFKKISEWKANANIIAVLFAIVFFAGFIFFLIILS